MPARKTVIVVGAGASKEANLPIGHELKEIIASLLNFSFKNGRTLTSGDYLILQALDIHVRKQQPPSDINTHVRAARTIKDAMPQAISIDNFIDARQGDERIELCGKLAIVRSILSAERSSILHLDSSAGDRMNFHSLGQSWFNSFFQVLTENCRIGELRERLQSFALIVFNYDRCIEHFLFHSLQNYYGINAEQAADLLSSLEIYHPYGTVGHLPWQPAKESVAFGAEPGAGQLLQLSREIKTFTEGTDPESSEIIAIQRRILESNVLIFLGFAFHRLNLKLLKSPVPPDSSVYRQIFATAKGVSNSDCNVIVTDLNQMTSVPTHCIHLRNDLVCQQLFHEFGRSVSISE